MRACENVRREKAEQDMNAAYAALDRRLTGRRKANLGAAQRAWLQFRDANAAFYRSEAEGGTLAPLTDTSARADMTEARAAELKKILDQ